MVVATIEGQLRKVHSFQVNNFLYEWGTDRVCRHKNNNYQLLKSYLSREAFIIWPNRTRIFASLCKSIWTSWIVKRMSSELPSDSSSVASMILSEWVLTTFDNWLFSREAQMTNLTRWSRNVKFCSGVWSVVVKTRWKVKSWTRSCITGSLNPRKNLMQAKKPKLYPLEWVSASFHTFLSKMIIILSVSVILARVRFKQKKSTNQD